MAVIEECLFGLLCGAEAYLFFDVAEIIFFTQEQHMVLGSELRLPLVELSHLWSAPIFLLKVRTVHQVLEALYISDGVQLRVQ